MIQTTPITQNIMQDRHLQKLHRARHTFVHLFLEHQLKHQCYQRVRAMAIHIIIPSADVPESQPPSYNPRSVRAPAPPASTARVGLTSPAAARAKTARRASGPSLHRPTLRLPLHPCTGLDRHALTDPHLTSKVTVPTMGVPGASLFLAQVGQAISPGRGAE